MSKQFDGINRLMGARHVEQEYINAIYKMAFEMALRSDGKMNPFSLVSAFVEARQHDWIENQYHLTDREKTCAKRLTETLMDDEGEVKATHYTYIVVDKDEVDPQADHIFC